MTLPYIRNKHSYFNPAINQTWKVHWQCTLQLNLQDAIPHLSYSTSLGLYNILSQSQPGVSTDLRLIPRILLSNRKLTFKLGLSHVFPSSVLKPWLIDRILSHGYNLWIYFQTCIISTSHHFLDPFPAIISIDHIKSIYSMWNRCSCS